MDLAFAVALNLIVFFAIGLGPSALLALPKRCPVLTFGTAPAFGFVVVTIVGTYLTLLDIPVSHWFTPLVIIAMFGSFAVAWLAYRSAVGSSQPANPRVAIFGIAGLALTFALTVSPPVIGGLKYFILRGNGSDSFNYVALAGYLDHEPLSWASHVDRQTLLARHQSYERARQLLSTRWASSMMLAFSSDVAGVSGYRFDYCFGITCFLLAYGVIYALCTVVLIPPALSVMCALAICAGFWGQFVLDIRAISQQNSIPVVLLIVILIGRVDASPGNLRIKQALLGLSGAALFNLYPETVPMILLGMSLFFGIRLLRRESDVHHLLNYFIALAVAGIALLPTARAMLQFVRANVAYAAMGANNWHIAYFQWLYGNLAAGPWGLSLLPRNGLFGIVQFGLTLLGALLTMMLLFTTVRLLLPKRGRLSGEVLITLCLLIAALTQWSYLASKGQLWAGAKGLSFGYPFLMLLLPLVYLSIRAPATLPLPLYWNRGATLLVVGSVLAQCGLAFVRPATSKTGMPYWAYMFNHGEYQQHDWDLSGIDHIVSHQAGLTVWSSMSNPWVADYVGFVLGWKVKLINVGITPEMTPVVSPHPQQETSSPDYVIVETKGMAVVFGSSSNLIERTQEFSVFNGRLQHPMLTAVVNPNGVEGPATSPFFWAGGPPTKLTIFSPSDGPADLAAHFSMGPCLPGRDTRTLMLRSSSVADPHIVVVSANTRLIGIDLTRGMSEVTLQVSEKPTVYLPNDPRPLLLRVDDLRVIERGDPTGVAVPTPHAR